MQVTPIPKPNANHVKLSPYKYRQLMDKVFERDGWQCECGNVHNLTLAHIIHKGQGGKNGPGDVIENCKTLCAQCHLDEEMNNNGRVKNEKNIHD